MCKCSTMPIVVSLAMCRLALTCDKQDPARDGGKQHKEETTDGWIVVLFPRVPYIWHASSKPVGLPDAGVAGGFAGDGAEKIRPGCERHRDQDRPDHALQRARIRI